MAEKPVNKDLVVMRRRTRLAEEIQRSKSNELADDIAMADRKKLDEYNESKELKKILKDSAELQRKEGKETDDMNSKYSKQIKAEVDAFNKKVSELRKGLDKKTKKIGDNWKKERATKVTNVVTTVFSVIVLISILAIILIPRIRLLF